MSQTSYSHDKNASWPFVTIPDWGRRGYQILELSKASYLALCPLVTSEQRTEWQSWSQKNQAWISESSYLSAQLGNVSTAIPPYIYHWDPTYNMTPEIHPLFDQYFAPIWQVAPVIPSIVNMDVFSWAPDGASLLAEVFPALSQTQSVMLSRFSTKNGGKDVWPFSLMAAPVFDSFDANQSSIVAILSSFIQWHNFFMNLLPEGSYEMIVVVENTCGQVVTYILNGSDVAYLGTGDLHDVSMDYLEMSSPFDVLASSVGEVSEICSFHIRVYPSQRFYDASMSNKPTIYTVCVALIFVITSATFVIYDILVQRRQDKVETSAKRSNAIVSSLFPAQVRDRLLEDDGAKKKESKGAILRLDTRFTKREAEEFGNATLLESKPIADLFPGATVMFGDISGFTAWASVREPVQVFTLLEQIYR